MKLYLTIIFLLVFSSFAYSQSIQLISPDWGEELEPGLSYNIRWTSEDLQNIRIEYSADNGNSWNTISSSFPAFAGSYNWYVPQIGSGQVLIRISDINDNSISDTGIFILAYFSSEEQNIKQENINSTLGTTSSSTLISPNGGESWRVGSAIDITWHGGDIVESELKIQYSTDSGTTWTTIISTTPNDSIFTWTNIPNTGTTNGRIRLVNLGDDSEYDGSNGDFTIEAITPSITNFPVRILPLGNSITFGINYDIIETNGSVRTNYNTGDLAGYEWPLWDSLRTNNYNFDFIGSEFSGYNVFPDFQNGGFPGINISWLTHVLETGENNKFTPPDKITSPDAYLNVYTPDIVLLHIGSNTYPGVAATEAANLGTLLDRIFSSAYNPNWDNTWVVLALILNSADSSVSSYYNDLNVAIKDMANPRINSITPERILIVNMYEIPGFDYTIGGDLTDTQHPNYSGYNLMAGEWYKALKLIMPAGTPTAPSFSQSSVDTVAYVGIPFNYQAVALGIGPPVYSITGPADSIYRYTGKVSWTPTSVGEVYMTITASNGTNPNAEQNLMIHVLQQPSLPNSLVSYWRFDENNISGPFVDEYNLNNGYTESSLTSTTGQANGAYTFDGTDKVNILDQPDFDFQEGSSFTVEAWINVNGGSGNRVAVGKYGRLIDESNWWLGINSSGQATFFVDQYSSGRNPVTAIGSSVTSGWHHLVGVKDGGSNITVYLDGVAGTPQSLDGISALIISSRPLNIGHLYNNYLFNGSIDEVTIYNDTLSSTTILDQYDRGIAYHEGYFDIHASVTAFLQGPYSGGTMSTELNGILPLNQPYDTLSWNYYGNEKVTSIPNSDIVDWVLLELRSVYDSSAVASRAAFINKYGDIVDLDGTSQVDFTGISSGDYYILVRHRNHLAVMSQNKVTLPNMVAYDFTTSDTSYYGTGGAKEIETGVWGMIAGDVNGDGVVKYNLSQNDRALIYQRIGGGNVNLSVSGYYNEDINLDGVVKYNLANNDRALIYQTIGGGNVNITVSTQVP